MNETTYLPIITAFLSVRYNTLFRPAVARRLIGNVAHTQRWRVARIATVFQLNERFVGAIHRLVTLYIQYVISIG